MKTFCLLLFLALALPCLADPDDVVVLLQPDQVIGQRLQGNTKDFADFVKSCMSAFEKTVPNEDVRNRASFVIAFGPGYHSQSWVIGDNITDLQKSDFDAKIRNLKAPESKGGFVAFEILGKKSTAAEKKGANGFAPLIPQEWKQAVSKSDGASMHTDQILEKLMVKSPASSGTTP